MLIYVIGFNFSTFPYTLSFLVPWQGTLEHHATGSLELTNQYHGNYGVPYPRIIYFIIKVLNLDPLVHFLGARSHGLYGLGAAMKQSPGNLLLVPQSHGNISQSLVISDPPSRMIMLCAL